MLPPKLGASVRRERLIEALQERRDCRLTLVLGGAGSGKTTLISAWRQELVKADHDVAWYNLGPDDDEAQFASYMVASCASIGLALAPASPATFHDHSAENSLDALLPALVNEIEDHEKAVYLVIEDLHYVASAAIHLFLERLIASAPANLHLVLSSRKRPALAIEALRAKNELSEISFSELRFTVEETAAFLRVRAIRSLTMHDVAALHQLTDGWPAGLQLAAFALRRSANPQLELKLMASPQGVNKEDAFDTYVKEVAAESLDEEELSFLTRLSACRRFNRELARIVTGNERAEELLQRLASEELFIVPIESEDDDPLFRFHRLFARFLQERLLELPEDELRTLNLKASRWFADKRLYVEALRHAHYAGDQAFYVDVLDRAARSFLKTSSFNQLLSLYERASPDLVGERVNLLLCVAWAQISVERTAALEVTLAATHNLKARLDAATQFEVRLLEALHLHMREDTAGMLELLEPHIAGPRPTSDFNTLMLFDLTAGALIYAHQYERARDLVRHQYVREIAERVGLPTADIDAHEGFSYLEQGNMPLAKQSLTNVIQEAARASILSLDLERRLGRQLALALYQLDEIDQAEALLQGSEDLFAQAGVGNTVWMAFLVLARIQDLRGNPAGALKLLAQFEDEAIARGRDRVTALCQGEMVRLYVRTDQVLAGEEYVRRLSQRAEKYATARNCAYADAPLASDVARAELALATGDYDRAATLLNPWTQTVQSQGRQFHVAALGAKSAVAHALAGDRARALAMMDEAVKAAAPYNLRRVFLDERPVCLDLLEEKSLAGELAHRDALFVRDILDRRANASKTLKDAAAGTASSAAALSRRELEILKLMDRSFSTKSIARALNLSVQTVKWYMKSMYAKLGAFSREGAIMQARKQGILSS